MGPSATYTANERLLDKVCQMFVKRHGGDFTECRSLANEIFCNAWNNYDEDKGVKFQTYLWSAIWNRLISQARTNGRRKPVWREMAEDFNAETLEGPSSAKESELSQDADFLIRTVLDPPFAAPKKPAQWRSMLWDYLYDIGWSASRITKSFGEIREMF